LKEFHYFAAAGNGIRDHQAVFHGAQILRRERIPRRAAGILPLRCKDSLIPTTVGGRLWMLDNEDAVGHRIR